MSLSTQSNTRQSTRSRRAARPESRPNDLFVTRPVTSVRSISMPPNDGDGDGNGNSGGNSDGNSDHEDGNAQDMHNTEPDGGDEDGEDGDGANVVDITEDLDGGNEDAEETAEEVPMEIDAPFDSTGLREIGNLACWTVSTYKPGCGVEALRDEDTSLFWQSDGPQPHHLNIHFARMASIRSIRIFLDFEADESYTPTRITLLAGTGYHDLIPFAALEFSRPKGWIDVPLEGVGGGEDGNTLRAFLVQIKVIENHQNGKDSHIRGLKIYAKDDRFGRGIDGVEVFDDEDEDDDNAIEKIEEWTMEFGGLANRTFLGEPDWMVEPEIR